MTTDDIVADFLNRRSITFALLSISPPCGQSARGRSADAKRAATVCADLVVEGATGSAQGADRSPTAPCVNPTN